METSYLSSRYPLQSTLQVIPCGFYRSRPCLKNWSDTGGLWTDSWGQKVMFVPRMDCHFRLKACCWRHVDSVRLARTLSTTGVFPKLVGDIFKPILSGAYGGARRGGGGRGGGRRRAAGGRRGD